MQILNDKNEKRKARVIALVGPDGAGKTTHARVLTDRLCSAGHNAICIRPIFMLMEIITGKQKMLKGLSPRLYRIDRVKDKGKLNGLLRKSLLMIFGYPYIIVSHLYLKYIHRKKGILICDRYFFQVFYDIFGKQSKWIKKLMPTPDLTFYLQTDFNIFRSRQSHSDSSYPSEYFQSVECFFSTICKDTDIISCDNSVEFPLVHEFIYNQVLEKIKEPLSTIA